MHYALFVWNQGGGSTHKHTMAVEVTLMTGLLRDFPPPVDLLLALRVLGDVGFLKMDVTPLALA